MIMVAWTWRRLRQHFGKSFAETEKFFEVDGGEKYFTDELLNVLVETPKDKLGEVLGADALDAFVQYIGEELVIGK